MDIRLESPAFFDNQLIPSKYTCDGENLSPPLRWSGLPAGTKSVALIMDDPDAPAGNWVHWVLYDIPASETRLFENQPKSNVLSSGAVQGLNSWRQIGYGGPCPPSGKHRYIFKIYALDCFLKLGNSVTKELLIKEIEKHLLASGKLIGLYSRKR